MSGDDKDPDTGGIYITGFMVVGLAIACFTAYKLAELFAGPCVPCP